MVEIGHVFDESAGWEQRNVATQLIDRLPREKYSHNCLTLDPAARTRLRDMPCPLQPIPRIAGVNLLAAPLLRSAFSRLGMQVIHVWGPSSAACAASASSRPMVVTLFDPKQAIECAKMLRTISRPRGFAIACATQWLRRRLIENGVNPDVCVVIRPGVDFAAIQKMKKSSLRNDFGIPQNSMVLLGLEPSGAGDESVSICWSAALLSRLDSGHTVIIPGCGPAIDRVTRFVRGLPTAPLLITPGSSAKFEDLIAIADALVIPEPGDVSTTAIAWAMGSGAVIIAAAGYAVAELVVARVNGLLYKHTDERSAFMKIIPLLRDRDTQRKVAEAARGQAYEVFSLRRCVEQYARLYENVLSGAAPSEGITDPAQVA